VSATCRQLIKKRVQPASPKLALLVTLVVSGCTNSTVDSRFPTFEELAQIESSPLDDDIEIEKSMELQSRLLFSSAEIEEMYQSSDVDSLIVVYLKAQYDDPRAVASLEKARSHTTSDRLVSLLTVDHCSYPVNRESYNYCDRDAFEALLTLDPDNMVSYYIAAGYSHSIGDYHSALHLLRRGNQLDKYDSYGADFFALLVKRAKAFGFPTYVANANAFGSFFNVMTTQPWFDMCGSEISESRREISSECVRMGKNIEEHSKTILEKSLAIGLQIRALETQKGRDDEVSALHERRGNLQEASSGLSDIPSEFYTQEMWERFYAEVFEIGEVAAFENLIDRASRGSSM